jgi:hypothetical protein
VGNGVFGGGDDRVADGRRGREDGLNNIDHWI